MKKCQFCAEEIQDEAIVCRHCNRNLLTGKAPQAAGPKPMGSGKLASGIAFGVILAVVGLTLLSALAVVGLILLSAFCSVLII